MVIQKMSVCFSTRSSLRSQREREKGEREEKKCLSFLFKKTLLLSLSFQELFLFLSRYVLAVDSFFFPSLLDFFSVKSNVLVFLSLFPLLGRSENTSVCLSSLSLKKSASWKTPTKPDLPFEYSAAKREQCSSLRRDQLQTRARKQEKRWIRFLSLVAARTAAHAGVASKRQEQIICITLRPPPRGMPPKFILL